MWLLITRENSKYSTSTELYSTVIYWRPVTPHRGHLPQRMSLRSWVPRVVFAMLRIDATGGWQVAARRGGPWWCCDYCCTAITSMPPQRSLVYTNSTSLRAFVETNINSRRDENKSLLVNINTTSNRACWPIALAADANSLIFTSASSSATKLS